MKEHAIFQTIRKRYSCRSYTGEPISAADRENLTEFINELKSGPFGSKAFFKLIASEPGDSETLKGLGTYGFIKRAVGFIVGSANESPMYLEDFGYCMERIILYATEMGLGTCWLGGTFRKSKFSQRAEIADGMEIPAVAAIGYIADKMSLTEKLIRRSAKSDKRRSVHKLFFLGSLDNLDDAFYASPYGTVLEMVRLAPSASNRQPWRIVAGRSKKEFHFFLERTPGYNNNRFVKSDLQRVDMGIAMCHFELAMKESGLNGSWTTMKPQDINVSAEWEYVASWN